MSKSNLASPGLIDALNARPAPRELPVPDAAEAARSATLARAIAARIDQAGGAIDFEAFMTQALYAPGLGYYSGPQQKFGAAGDFVTAPELSPLFGECLAQQCAEVLALVGGGDVLEVGAGSGALAAQILSALERRGAAPKRYFILELSADLRARQRDTIAARAPQAMHRVEWLDAWPTSLTGVVVANELLDAMPVQRFWFDGATAHLLTVRHDGERLLWDSRVAPSALAQRIAALELPADYVSEIGLQAEAWVASLGDVLTRGAALLIDYGFPRAEFYHPQRSGGSLMCHYRHRAHDNPLILPGLQDITAHIDFTAVAEAAQAAGLEVHGYTSQAAFLLGTGIMSLVEASDPNDTRAHLALTQAVKKLTLPSEMGELFKVMALTRGIDAPLQGFGLSDRRRSL